MIAAEDFYKMHREHQTQSISKVELEDLETWFNLFVSWEVLCWSLAYSITLSTGFIAFYTLVADCFWNIYYETEKLAYIFSVLTLVAAVALWVIPSWIPEARTMYLTQNRDCPLDFDAICVKEPPFEKQCCVYNRLRLFVLVNAGLCAVMALLFGLMWARVIVDRKSTRDKVYVLYLWVMGLGPTPDWSYDEGTN
ncbi:unnamed protein product [Cyprideis torosa]|uniref:Uncharacterized protein n=1 Tax=Cyprideis torosa TaxID=163714 RepID=A0A7R8WRS5_9CRUS|nr:unnamed protein product [Cyprideis torosa]CAG0902942.1 unnamed protein product [Cyprideis torosa]